MIKNSPDTASFFQRTEADSSVDSPKVKGGLGQVSLVGAGPGDPDLLTVKAIRLIGEADIVFSDRLIGRRILPMTCESAEIVFVGKSKGEHTMPQEEIHKLMVDAAREGKSVVRLKGGDPFVFGRGGEEVQALREAGIEPVVVPGVSSALGCAASLQIPLTHRGYAQAVTFVTGHAAVGEEPDLDWQALAKANQTVVVFMGVGTAPTISARLIEHGRAGETPVAIIENGTRRNEIFAYGQLGDLANVIERSNIQGPALLVIGEVARLGRGADAFLKEIAGVKAAATGDALGAPKLSELWEKRP